MKITAVNHASVLIEQDGHFVLTDPWVISPAFGGWVQEPGAPVELIREILEIPPSSLSVVVSHGHDDHVDEFFIQHHLSNSKFFIPKFRGDGFSKRIERLTGERATELEWKPVQHGPFHLRSLVNEEFTNYDGIVAIESGNGVCLHANDNWHSYSEDVMEKLRPLVDSHEDVYFMTQFGIADCFPMSYPNFSEQECDALIEQRLSSYVTGTCDNLKRLGIDRGYYYANQSVYDYPAGYKGASMYQRAQRVIEDRGMPFDQTHPGEQLGVTKSSESSSSVFDFLLARLERLITEKLNPEIPVHLRHAGSADPDAVTLFASRSVWQRILIGELTLEAITIGGVGLVYKPNDRNIGQLQRQISKLAYFIQSMIRKDGLGFLLSS